MRSQCELNDPLLFVLCTHQELVGPVKTEDYRHAWKKRGPERADISDVAARIGHLTKEMQSHILNLKT